MSSITLGLDEIGIEFVPSSLALKARNASFTRKCANFKSDGSRILPLPAAAAAAAAAVVRRRYEIPNLGRGWVAV